MFTWEFNYILSCSKSIPSFPLLSQEEILLIWGLMSCPNSDQSSIAPEVWGSPTLCTLCKWKLLPPCLSTEQIFTLVQASDFLHRNPGVQSLASLPEPSLLDSQSVTISCQSSSQKWMRLFLLPAPTPQSQVKIMLKRHCSCKITLYTHSCLFKLSVVSTFSLSNFILQIGSPFTQLLWNLIITTVGHHLCYLPTSPREARPSVW